MAILPRRHRRRKPLSRNTEFALIAIVTIVSVLVWSAMQIGRLGVRRAGLVLASAAVFIVCGACWAATDQPDHHPTCVPNAPGMYQGTVCD